MEILSLPDFLQDGSLQTLRTPALLFYKMTFVLKGKAQPLRPPGRQRRPQGASSWAEPLTRCGCPTPAAYGRELHLERCWSAAFLEQKTLRNFSNYGVLKNNVQTLSFLLSLLYNSFQDTSQVQIFSGIWPKEIKYGPIENLGVTSKTWATGPHLPLSKIELFSVRPSVESVYPTLYSHGIVSHFWGFKNKVD